MILKFGAYNAYSFKEAIEISFESKDGINKVIALKGKNGAGKTNVLKIFYFLCEFIPNSFALKPEEKIKYNTFFNNDEESEFYIEFMIDGTKYEYNLTIDNNIITNETIYRTKATKSWIIKRSVKEIETRKEFEDVKDKIASLRSNVSILSLARQYDARSIEPLYRYFSGLGMSNVRPRGMISLKLPVGFISQMYYQDKSIFELVKSELKRFDTGIQNIKIVKEEIGDRKMFMPVFIFRVGQKYKTLSYSDQSSGIKALFNDLYLINIHLKEGRILTFDELDKNYHPEILQELVNMFVDEEKNQNGAQLLFTTHNNEIMDELGHEAVYIIDKEDNESFGYRLDEVPSKILRSDRKPSISYKKHKIGGYPKL